MSFSLIASKSNMHSLISLAKAMSIFSDQYTGWGRCGGRDGDRDEEEKGGRGGRMGWTGEGEGGIANDA